jgi:hypothetical protein
MRPLQVLYGLSSFMNAHNLDKTCELFAQDVVAEFQTRPYPILGLDRLRPLLRSLYDDAFELVVDYDKAVEEVSVGRVCAPVLYNSVATQGIEQLHGRSIRGVLTIDVGEVGGHTSITHICFAFTEEDEWVLDYLKPHPLQRDSM